MRQVSASQKSSSKNGEYDIAYRYTLLAIVPVTIDAARRLANLHPLRAYDAVQLATAWSLDRDLVSHGEAPLTFICADDRLLSIAQAEGLRTDNPNHHV